MKTHKCNKCSSIKPKSEFYKRSDRPIGIQSVCKTCTKKYNKDNRERLNKVKADWYIKNKKKHNEASKLNYINNKERYLERYKKNRLNNLEEYKEKSREYYLNNKERLIEIGSERDRKRYKNDPLFKLKKLSRSRIYNFLTNIDYKKNKTIEKMIGCSFEELKEHIESKFSDDMSWDNYGEWHVDHIIPLCSVETEEDIIKLCNYKNLQPLWKEDNLKKGGRHETF